MIDGLIEFVWKHTVEEDIDTMLQSVVMMVKLMPLSKCVCVCVCVCVCQRSDKQTGTNILTEQKSQVINNE